MKTIRNMQTIVREIAYNRRANAAAAASFAIRTLNKDGSVSKAADHPLNLVRTQMEADRRLAHMQEINPTRTFVIVAL